MGRSVTNALHDELASPMEHQVTGQIVDVLGGDIYPARLTIRQGIIAHVARLTNAPDHYILPGLIDAHIHIESSLLTPCRFAEVAVLHGTTAVVTNPHEIANVAGMEGIRFMIEDGGGTPLRFYFTAPPCVPSTKWETAGAVLERKDILEMMRRPDCVALGEVMNYWAVINGDPEMIAKIEVAKLLGKPVDGHCPDLRGVDLDRYIAAGITTDHECVSLEEAEEKYRKGMTIMVREGSAAKDLEMLLPFAREHRHFLVTDDLHAVDLIRWHLDGLLKKAVGGGVDPMHAVRAATLWPAEHYGLQGGTLRVGGVADLVVVEDLSEFKVLETWIGGKLVAKNGVPLFNTRPTSMAPTMPRLAIDRADLMIQAAGKVAMVRVIEVRPDHITSRAKVAQLMVVDGHVVPDSSQDVLLLAVVNRYAEAKPALAFVKGFGLRSGAIASSVAHDSHNIIVVGTNHDVLAAAINGLTLQGGGYIAIGGERIRRLELPIAGLMSDRPCKEVAIKEVEINEFVKGLGCPLPEPFATLSFQSLLVVPELKLGDRGLYDSVHMKFVNPVMDDGRIDKPASGFTVLMPSLLKKCVEESPVVLMGGYDYFVCPITDGIPFMDPKVLDEIIDRIMDIANLDCDLIVAPEAMGIPLAIPLSLRTGIPYNIVRKRKYGLPGEISVCQITGYSKCQMYINGLRSGDRVVVVDDIVSTGGTLSSIVRALMSMGVVVVDVIVVIEKGTGKERLEKELALKIKTLIKADVVNGRVVASDPSCSQSRS